MPDIPKATQPPSRSGAAFEVAPSVAVADKASSRTTVVEVNAFDRPALLAALARAIHDCGHRIHSAHIATYGERAVDVFYLTDPAGKKLGPAEVGKLRQALLDAAIASNRAVAA